MQWWPWLCQNNFWKYHTKLGHPQQKWVPKSPLQLNEIADFLKSMSTNNKPGFSSLKPAIYKFFFPSARLSPWTPKRHPPTLIPKQYKDTRYVSNLRTITQVSNYDKIISVTLTTRLKPILNRLIEDWQKAYLPNRYIGNITRNTFDMFYYTKQTNIPGIMLQIDFRKAFYSTSFKYFKSNLKLYGFCGSIKHWQTKHSQAKPSVFEIPSRHTHLKFSAPT